MNLLQRVKQFIMGLEEEESLLNRDVITSQIWSALNIYLYDNDMYDCYTYEHMVSQDGNYFIMVNMGKLYKLSYTIDESSNIVFSEMIPVSLTVQEETQSRTKVFRDASGKLKFFSVSSAATINRVGEIDSTTLYDSFEENFKDDVYLTFYHNGESLEFGKVRGVLRQDNVLVTYGEIDESTPIGAHAEYGLSQEGWGVSIGFRPTAREIIRIGDEQIPVSVYTSGKLVEVSVLKEKDAASFFTSIVPIKDGEQRMAKFEKALEALTEFVGDENKAREILKGADITNRSIEDAGLITRESDVQSEENETVTEEVQVVESIQAVDAETEVEVEIDDVLLEKIVEQSVARAIAKISETINVLSRADVEEIVRAAIQPVREQVQEVSEVVSDDKPIAQRRAVYRATQSEVETTTDKPLNTKELRKARLDSTRVS